jgi:hypothetical protein
LALAARNDRLDARVAKRKVRAELRRYRRELRAAVDYPSTMEYAVFGEEEWTKHSDRLARQLSDADWDAVEKAYDDTADVILKVGEPPHEWPTPDEVKRAYEHVEDALKRLS